MLNILRCRLLSITCTVAGLTFGCAKVDTRGVIEPDGGSVGGKGGSGGSIGGTTTDSRIDSSNAQLTQGEEALAFLFFDLASCIQDDTKPPIIP